EARADQRDGADPPAVLSLARLPVPTRDTEVQLRLPARTLEADREAPRPRRRIHLGDGHRPFRMERAESESARLFLFRQEQSRRGRASRTIADAMLLAIGQDDLERQPARFDLARLPAGDRRRGPAE